MLEVVRCTETRSDAPPFADAARAHRDRPRSAEIARDHWSFVVEAAKALRDPEIGGIICLLHRRREVIKVN